MGHTKPDDLKDLQELLNVVRKWTDIKEKSQNVFYIKSKPFLHFHDKDGHRWADVMNGNKGVSLDIPFQATAQQKKSFASEILACYQKIIKK